MLNSETVGVDDLDTESIGSDARLDTPLLLVLENGPLPSDQTPWTLSHMNHTIHNEKQYK